MLLGISIFRNSLLGVGVLLTAYVGTAQQTPNQTTAPGTVTVNGMTLIPSEVTLGKNVQSFDSFWSYSGLKLYYINDLDEYLGTKGEPPRSHTLPPVSGKYPQFDVKDVARIEFSDFSEADISALAKPPAECHTPQQYCEIRRAKVVFRSSNRKPLEHICLFLLAAQVMDLEGRDLDLGDGDIRMIVFKPPPTSYPEDNW